MPKPQLAVDWRADRLKELFAQKRTIIAQPKLDGVRGGQYNPRAFTGRSLKPFKNKRLTKFWSDIEFFGVDGELIMPPPIEWNYHAMCRSTTSVTNTIDSGIIPNLVAFDLIIGQTIDLPYRKRYAALRKFVEQLRQDHTHRIHLMPMQIVKSMTELDEWENKWVEEGYEGAIVRNGDALFKEDRSGEEAELWRIKRRIDFEFIADELVEAMENRNEAKTNALGRTERSTHKENMHGKRMVGAIKGHVLKDVVWQGKVLFPKGMPIKVGPGEMDHAMRKRVWKNPKLIVGKINKAKTQPHGVKEKPRQPLWIGLRSKEDMS